MNTRASSQKPDMTGTRSALMPAFAALLLMAAGKILYNLPWHDMTPSIHKPAAFISGLVLFIAITLAPSAVYPLGRFRGAAARTCIMACLITPLVWNIWEIIRVTAFFSPAESLYYGLNPLFLGTLAFAAFQAGLWESVYRLRVKRPGKKTQLAGPMLSALAGLGLLYVFCFWAMGQPWFYLYQEGYKALFH